jgi:hypothetical protein
VVVTQYGKPSVVIISAVEYARLKELDRRVMRLDEMSAGEIEEMLNTSIPSEHRYRLGHRRLTAQAARFGAAQDALPGDGPYAIRSYGALKREQSEPKGARIGLAAIKRAADERFRVRVLSISAKGQAAPRPRCRCLMDCSRRSQ